MTVVGVFRHKEFGWVRVSAFLAVLSGMAVAADMLLRVYIPAYTHHQLGRIPYIGRGCVRGFEFSKELAYMNMDLSAVFTILFLLTLAASAVSVYACGGYRLPAIAVSVFFDSFCLFAVLFVLIPMIETEVWTAPALFDVGFAGGILAATCGAYGVTELAVEESVS
jgi:hypothetical protein